MAIAPLLMLAGCGERGEAPGGVSADEARELNEAAAMLDENSVSANAVDRPASPAAHAPTRERD